MNRRICRIIIRHCSDSRHFLFRKKLYQQESFSKFGFYYKVTKFIPMERFSSHGKDMRFTISRLCFSLFVFVIFLSGNGDWELDWFILFEELNIGIRVCEWCAIHNWFISMTELTANLGEFSPYRIKRDTYTHAEVYQAGEVNGLYDAWRSGQVSFH